MSIFFKKLLVFLVLASISTHSFAHEIEHKNLHAHHDELHVDSIDGHMHFEHGDSSVDTHNHQPSLHKHLDELYLRSSRQRKFENKLLLVKLFYFHKTYFDTCSSHSFKSGLTYLNTYYSKLLFSSRNQPLLI